MRDEIHAGLKNAIERGSTLEAAIQSFINAGYNPVEVKEAANSLTSGASSIINTLKKQQSNPQESSLSAISSNTPINPQHFMPQQNVPKPGMNPKKKRVLIVLSILLVIVLGSIIGIIFFLEEISKFLNNLISS